MIIANTIVTGGTGMVGMQFHKGLAFGSTQDLRNKKVVNHLFDLYNPKQVIHCAAKVGGVGANMKANAEFFYDNVMMNTNIIEACRTHNVERAAFFLSTCVFPDKIDYPLTEDKIHLGPGHPSNYGYSYAKRMMEVQVRSYNEQYGTKYFCVIPCNIYGPYDNFNLEGGHVIPALIHKVYLARENNLPYVEVWGDGSAKREFIFSKDVARLTTELLEKTDFTGNIIISNPEEYSIKQLVNNIVTLMNYKGEVKWLTDKPNGQHRKPSSIAKLESVLGRKIVNEDGRCDGNLTNLWDGLKETIEWFEKNYPNVRK